MDRHNSAGEVRVAHTLKVGVLDLLGPLGLFGEHANRFDKVLVRIFVVGDHVAHLRNHIEGVRVVELLKARHDHMRKLETHESTSRSQHSVSLL